jgi:mannose-6-phosphate isomerase class I
MRYDTDPRYDIEPGALARGYDSLLALIAAAGTVALDGPPTPDWDHVAGGLAAAAERAGISIALVDSRRWFPAWPELIERTKDSVIDGDPHLARLFEGSVADLVDVPSELPAGGSAPVVVFGPGAAAAPTGATYYLDTPRRHALARCRQAGAVLGRVDDQQPDFRRMVFVDWPAVERWRLALLPRVERYIDLRQPASPTHAAADAVSRAVHALVERPFRTTPHFLAGAWGGHWMQERWDLHRDEPNLAWSYEIIAPEAGVVFDDGSGTSLELPLDLLVALEPEHLLGATVHDTYGYSFPIRFDYLDTYDGEPLSIHCHPSDGYMADIFGWPYSQYESYYVMQTRPGSEIFLGLRADTDMEALAAACRAATDEGIGFDPAIYINRFDAEQHGLYLIPVGTPHASGEGNLVLEISSTPYFYSLRLYDWLRVDLDGQPRAVHIDHALHNVVPDRRGDEVAALHCQPVAVRPLDGGAEYRLVDDDRVPFTVYRLEFRGTATDSTDGQFAVLNLVEGGAVTINAGGTSHQLNYGETIIVPAATGDFEIVAAGDDVVKLVKASVRR